MQWEAQKNSFKTLLHRWILMMLFRGCTGKVIVIFFITVVNLTPLDCSSSCSTKTTPPVVGERRTNLARVKSLGRTVIGVCHSTGYNQDDVAGCGAVELASKGLPTPSSASAPSSAEVRRTSSLPDEFVCLFARLRGGAREARTIHCPSDMYPSIKAGLEACCKGDLAVIHGGSEEDHRIGGILSVGNRTLDIAGQDDPCLVGKLFLRMGSKGSVTGVSMVKDWRGEDGGEEEGRGRGPGGFILEEEPRRCGATPSWPCPDLGFSTAAESSRLQASAGVNLL